MNKRESMPKLSDVLRMIDRKKVLTDLRNQHYHQVSYNNSRTIIKYIEKDTVLTAYAYNPGNAVVIFPKKNGLIAYSCYFDGFPSGERYSSFHWSKIDMEKAISLIKEDIWEESDYIDDAVYEDTAYATQWEELATGRIEYTSSYSNSILTISNFKQTYGNYIYERNYTIFRLTSGRLRVEVDEKYFSFEEFVNIILFYREHKDDESVTMVEVPKLNSWQKVLSIDDFEDNILDDLKVQVISQKMKDAY
ncbi:MAG: hypothetical protein PF570_05595 [Candidatus Cloacimonetes bacterium]|jgi:hypothetical protein|nr:hypothetical protein [Candidatus Cloacimonadota bacterium]